MKSQKELKEIYMNIIKKEVWTSSTSMQEYARKMVAYVVELPDGTIIDFDKPKIQKDFCFGAGMYARATDEEMEETQSMVEHARTSENFFKRKNLEEINSQIENLYQALEGEYEVYTSLHYYGQEIGSRLKSYSICRISQNPEYAPGYWSNCRDLKKCGKDEIEIIISGLEQVRKAFAKRIDTYLKKYGTSKVNAWSYIRD
jgi:hypothetical protein|nr:MAG TPA: hypothetical protein [Bacteriophage sp.]DAU98941.1 MAG TPA: hypothetical protein [Bacteriophage sp.]